MGQNNFAGGFIAGAFVGGIIGGIVGVLASNRLRSGDGSDDFAQLSEEERRRFESATTEERMEIARRGLEDKISQLNMAIEDVRVQMSNVNNGHDYAGQDYAGAEYGSASEREA
ncbi:MAG: gas vesicle protein [Cyanobacteria bacterium J06621_11]